MQTAYYAKRTPDTVPVSVIFKAVMDIELKNYKIYRL